MEIIEKFLNDYKNEIKERNREFEYGDYVIPEPIEEGKVVFKIEKTKLREDFKEYILTYSVEVKYEKGKVCAISIKNAEMKTPNMFRDFVYDENLNIEKESDWIGGKMMGTYTKETLYNDGKIVSEKKEFYNPNVVNSKTEKKYRNGKVYLEKYEEEDINGRENKITYYNPNGEILFSQEITDQVEDYGAYYTIKRKVINPKTGKEVKTEEELEDVLKDNHELDYLVREDSTKVYKYQSEFENGILTLEDVFENPNISIYYTKDDNGFYWIDGKYFGKDEDNYMYEEYDIDGNMIKRTISKDGKVEEETFELDVHEEKAKELEDSKAESADLDKEIERLESREHN